MTFAPDPIANPAAKAVVDQFTKQGYKPEGYTLYTYAAFQVIEAGVKAAKSLDAFGHAEHLESGMMMGFSVHFIAAITARKSSVRASRV